MSEDIFDAIIVGAGLAGSVAALVLAREGADVLVIERGNAAGAKNVTGGRIYAHSLERIIPGFAETAPVERRITHEKLAFMTETGAMTMDYLNADEASASQVSYSVLRSKFDAWLMAQAEEAGAQLITGIRVDNVVQRDGKVVGVEADGDILEANVVILADGVNSLLAEKLGMAKRVDAANVAVGVKELIELPKSVIEDRFQLQGNEGAACLFAGSPTDGLMGGGFLYTNEDTLSLGLVCGLHHLKDAKKSVPQMLEDFKQHPAVAPLIAGGKMVEYSAHVVPEAGMDMQPELIGDGVLIAGDAAGMCMNLGFTIRGMDLAVAAGKRRRKPFYTRNRIMISAAMAWLLIASIWTTARCATCACISACPRSLIIHVCLPVTRKWWWVWHAICSPLMAARRCRCVRKSFSMRRKWALSI